MAQTFKTTDGDIAAVLATMVHAPEFTASLKSGARFKDPVQYVLSAVRLAYDDKVVLNTLPVQNWLNRLNEGLFNHDTPDGYAMAPASWNGPGQMMLRFEIARQIGSGSSATCGIRSESEIADSSCCSAASARCSMSCSHSRR